MGDNDPIAREPPKSSVASGTKNAFVDATLAAHCAKMQKVNSSRPSKASEMLFGSVEMMVGRNT